MTSLDTRLREQIAHAYANAPAVRRIMDNAGLTPADIQTVDDLPKLPVTSKDTLVEMQRADPPFGGWVAVPISQLQRIYLSPGPIYDAQGFDDDEAIQAAQEALKAAGLEPGDIALNTFLYNLVPTALWLDEALRQAGITVMPFGPGNTDLLIMVMMAVKANTFLGTPSYLDGLYAKAASMGLQPSALPLKKAFFAAEPYFPAQRQKFEGEFGLRTGQAYGTADLGLIGYEKAGKSGFYVPQTLIVEIADPQTGQRMPDGELGEVVVTTFARAYPLLRLGTGDLSVYETDEDGVRRLKGLFGRSGEAVKARGMFVHPNQVRLITAAFPMLRTVEAVISRPETQDMVTLRAELTEDSAGLDQMALAAQIQEAFRNQARLRLDQVEFVAPGTISGGRLVRDARG